MAERFSASDSRSDGLSRLNVGSNPGRDCGTCVLEQDTSL